MKNVIAAVVAAGALLLLFAVQPVKAQTVTVCGMGCDYGTIQDAIDAVTPGTAIHVDVDGAVTESSIVVDKSVQIYGNGPGETVIQAAAMPPDAMTCGAERVFLVSGDPVTLRDLTIQNGCVNNGTPQVSSSEGGGIWNNGDLRLIRVVVRNNQVQSANGRGGGIYNIGRLTLTRSVVHSNASERFGGGIYNSSFVAGINNSTISNNTAKQSGGGIDNRGFVSARYATLFDNTQDGGVRSDIVNRNVAEFLIANSVIGRCAGKRLIATGPTLAISPGCGIDVANAQMVDGLRFDRPLPYHLPIKYGAAVDAVHCNPATVEFDQVNTSRPQGGECDLGAIERPVKFFPIIGAAQPNPSPDLLIRDLSIDPPINITAGDPMTLTVVIENTGPGAIPANRTNFWVDLYINPSAPPPNEAGTTWKDLCEGPVSECLGLAWRVTKPLRAGEVVTLTSTYVDDNLIAILDPSQSNWDGTFDEPGAYELWAFVDSWNGRNRPEGWVHERNEDNNRFGPIDIFVNDCDCLPATTSYGEERTIPPRPLPIEWIKE